MIVWIVRTNGNLLAEGRYSHFFEAEESFLDQDEETEDDGDLVARQIAMSSLIKGVVNHSRTLSLSVYDLELIFCRIADYKYFYRAKHGLLFVFAQHLRHPLSLTITGIEQLIERVIRLYEATCNELSCSYSFQKFVGHYQQKQFQQIGKKIISILEEGFLLGVRGKTNCSSASACENMDSLLEKKGQLLERKEKYEKMGSAFQSNKDEGHFFQRASEKIVAKYRLSSLIAAVSVVAVLLMCWHFHGAY